MINDGTGLDSDYDEWAFHHLSTVTWKRGSRVEHSDIAISRDVEEGSTCGGEKVYQTRHQVLTAARGPTPLPLSWV